MTVRFSTVNGTATAPTDYAAATGTVTFPSGQTSEPATVQVNGDTAVEPNETFKVNLANATGNATIADAQGLGTIRNDDQPVSEQPSRISVADVRRKEGNHGRSGVRFTVSLDRVQSAPVGITYATRNGTAKAPGDYSRSAGTVSFAHGETTKTITVIIKGDKIKEPNERFNVNLATPTGNATIARADAVGKIVNDDRKHPRRRR